jgi:dipeptidyl aminopeptidase/acylaminoacyl peptidase
VPKSGDPHHPRAGRESNIRHVAPSPARPRLCASAVIVRAHSGPTANAPLRLDPWIQFFVGHGFAVLDVDYRGSTGYGRAYRNALRSQWGVLDVSDCVDAVQAVRQDASIDPNRVFISGASAGGYTALRAATSTTQFRAATIRSAIVDPVAWRTVAPKFQIASRRPSPGSNRQLAGTVVAPPRNHCTLSHPRFAW